MTDDELRQLHAALVLEDAQLHNRYDGQRIPTAIAKHWDLINAERAIVEDELTRRGLPPTP